MMITAEQLRAMLDDLEPWHWRGNDYRKVGKKIVRFVDWRKLAERKRRG